MNKAELSRHRCDLSIVVSGFDSDTVERLTGILISPASCKSLATAMNQLNFDLPMLLMIR